MKTNENEEFVQRSEFEKSSKSNDLHSHIFYFPIFFNFCYVVLKFSIGNISTDQNNVIQLFLILEDNTYFCNKIF